MDILFDNSKIIDGINLLNKAVSSTLGPRGRNVIIEDENGNLHITKDGVTVAKYVASSDPIENIGINLVRQAAEKAVSDTGDGTTTAILLASKLIQDGVNHLRDDTRNINIYKFKKGMTDALEGILHSLDKHSSVVSSVEELINIGTISANGNKEIGELVGKLSFSLANKGIITVNESFNNETTVNTINGYTFDKGMVNNYFSTEVTKNVFDVKDCHVLVYDGKLSTYEDMRSVINIVTTASGIEPILIIANDIEGDALALLVAYKVRYKASVCAVRSPELGNAKKETLEDIAIFTGGVIIADDRGTRLNSLTRGCLGKCKNVVVGKNLTILKEGSGSNEAISARIDQIHEYLKDTTLSPYKINDFKTRIAKLTVGVSEILVGASSQIEMRNLKDVYDDVVGACNTALKGGYITGGGSDLIRIYVEHMETSKQEGLSDYRTGFYVVINSLLYPITQILANAGLESEVKDIIDRITTDYQDHNDLALANLGYNPLTETYCNMVSAGILDPTDVVKASYKVAVSIAAEFLTTYCIIKP
jgi:chaperonin GroEL